MKALVTIGLVWGLLGAGEPPDVAPPAGPPPPEPSATLPAEGEAGGMSSESGPAPAVDLGTLDPCKDSVDLRIFTSPRRPHRKAPLRLLVVSEHPVAQPRLTVTAPDGTSGPLEATQMGGPPFGWIAEIPEPPVGTWRAALWDGDALVACKSIRVRRSREYLRPLVVDQDPIWKATWKWERDTENLYSLWIAHLFQAPPGEDVSWNPLAEVLRDPARNLLYDHLGQGEDRAGKRGLWLKPDCADFPYFLRAYFAWKTRLPFGFRWCSRQRGDRPPKCGVMATHLQPALDPSPVKAFETFMRKKLGGTVHSSTLRTLPGDDKSDLYPVALSRSSLRPGAVYSDPQGHTMVVSQWWPATDGAAGVLFAADAQPDGTVGRRRFWRGSFMFPEDGQVSGAGFKRFRPIVRQRGRYVAADNATIGQLAHYGDASLDQWTMGKQAFYDRMDELITPSPLPPRAALLATIDALDQQLRRRVASVENGEAYKRKRPGRMIPMPKGAKIFLTSGPWEDFSTPARDLRLLIAMDTVLGFPDRVIRLPERFVIPAGTTVEEVRVQLSAELEAEAARRTFTYQRSDQSPYTLTMADILARILRFEMSWNPNDCVEKRWGARDGDPDYATCQTHAPAKHLPQMEESRPWFRDRARPAM